MKLIEKTEKSFWSSKWDPVSSPKKTHLQTFFLDFLTFLSLNDQKKDFKSFGPEMYGKNGKQFFAVLTGTEFPLRENTLTDFFSRVQCILL